VHLNADYSTANGVKRSYVTLIPSTLETPTMRSIGIVDDMFDVQHLDSLRTELLLSLSRLGIETKRVACSISVKTQLSILQAIDGLDYNLHDSAESASYTLSALADGSLFLVPSTTCQQSAMMVWRQPSLPIATTESYMDGYAQENMLLSDSLPAPDMTARARLLFPTPVQEGEMLSISCKISDSLQRKIHFVGSLTFQLTRSMMTSSPMVDNPVGYKTERYPYGVNISMRGTFDRDSFAQSNAVLGSLRCRIEAVILAAGLVTSGGCLHSSLRTRYKTYQLVLYGSVLLGPSSVISLLRWIHA
jgi:hypothetical protein